MQGHVPCDPAVALDPSLALDPSHALSVSRRISLIDVRVVTAGVCDGSRLGVVFWDHPSHDGALAQHAGR